MIRLGFLSFQIFDLEALPDSESITNFEIIEPDNCLRTEIFPLNNFKKEIGSESTDKVGISLSLFTGCLDLNLTTRLRSLPAKI